jgi:hypothetical protein
MIEVISPEKQELLKQFYKKPETKTYTKEEIPCLRKEIERHKFATNLLRKRIRSEEQQIRILQHELFEAEMQHTPITVCKPAKRGRQKSVLNEDMAERILRELIAQNLVSEDEINF